MGLMVLGWNTFSYRKVHTHYYQRHKWLGKRPFVWQTECPPCQPLLWILGILQRIKQSSFLKVTNTESVWQVQEHFKETYGPGVEEARRNQWACREKEVDTDDGGPCMHCLLYSAFAVNGMGSNWSNSTQE